MPERFQVIAVGGGQAGLAAGYHLAKRALQFVILDDGSRVGDAWRRRWDSLRLFTPARINGLPGMPFPAPARSIVTKDQVADYMELYARSFGLPVRLGIRVESVTRDGGSFLASTKEEHFVADQVVVASGSYGTPRRPAFVTQLNPAIAQLHSTEYRNQSQFRDGDVLVVGAGNSGAEIAVDAAKTHRTFLSGRKTGQVPYPIMFARPMWWVANHAMTIDTPIGRRMAAQALTRGQPLVRTNEKLLAGAGVQRVPRVVGVRDGKPLLEDGGVLDVGTVVWATGFDHTYPWIKLPITDPAGHVIHKRGVVETQAGLYFLGIPFQRGITSSLIGGVGRDAEYVVEAVAARRSRA